MLSKKNLFFILAIIILLFNIFGCRRDNNSNYADSVQAFAINQNNENETEPATVIISATVPFFTAEIPETSEITTTEAITIAETSEESAQTNVIVIELTESPEPTETTESAQLYVITPSGKKYHCSDCRYAVNVKQYISKEEAEKSGYTACKICKPE